MKSGAMLYNFMEGKAYLVCLTVRINITFMNSCHIFQWAIDLGRLEGRHGFPHVSIMRNLATDMSVVSWR